MKGSTVSKRYARALVESISHEPEYRDIRQQLQHFIDILNANPTFKSGMETFLLSKKQKNEVLETLKSSLNLHEKTYNFLLAVIEENRMSYIRDIFRIFEELWLEKNGFEKVKVFSVIELNRDQQEKLAVQLENAIQKKIIIDNEIDPSLIAGIKIKRGSIFYDFSIEGNLNKLRETLTEVNIPESMVKIGVHDANKG